MRLFPIVVAILVSTILYLLVFERARLASLTAGSAPAAVQTQEDPAPAETRAGPAAAEEARVVSVVAMRSTARDVDSGVLLRGRTEAARVVDVRAETSGLIISEPLRKGASVDRDQTLCEIDPGTRQVQLDEALAHLPEAQARVAEAEARLSEAEINLNAAEKLQESGFASETRVASTTAAIKAAQAGVETAKSGVQSAEAAIAFAREDISRLDIKAPFAGLLETDTAELGTLMQPGALCATIIQLNPIKLVGFVPEADVAKITLGAVAGARLISDQQTQGTVTFLSRSADPQTRTFRVEITAQNDDLSIRDGQTAEILIASEGTSAHLLPSSALTLNDEGTLGVRLVNDGRAGFAPVQILRDSPRGVWVTGLREREEIIVIGQEFVTDGVRIEVSYQEATQ
ncbi:MAG: efflux RND transporter periplasmic adaptor subunit [Paracoccaceae bacterium]